MNGDDLASVLAVLVAAPRPLLIGLDLDGTLSPIAAHADHAALEPGALAALVRLDALPGVRVVVVTGRSRDDAHRRFALPGTMDVIGSHGAELPEGVVVAVDPDLLEHVADLAAGVIAETGADGAWVERKPVSVVLHVRLAPADAGRQALERFRAAAEEVELHVLGSHAAIEASPVVLDKSAAFEQVRREVGAASACFVGDDLTDERVFAGLGPGDVSVKVGDGPTVARHRLASPARVVELLDLLIEACR